MSDRADPITNNPDLPVKVEDLRFDCQNPRMPGTRFETDEDVVRILIDDFDVEELVQSILSSGWIDFEPMIVERGTNIVFEGNRRLAALKLIQSAGLRNAVNYNLPDITPTKPIPHELQVRFVNSRQEARRFIAFKHINGPFKWDAYAKARYAAEWLKEGENIDSVSRMLGDNHNTIRRLVNGFNVLEQAQDDGFDINDRSKKKFFFSHLYTAVSRPAVREYLGISDTAEDILPKKPVPRDHENDLLLLMSWLYGQEKKKEPSVVLSQNPDLNHLVAVIGNVRAREELLRSRHLDRAYEQVEPPSDRFKEALIKANQNCEEALGLSSHYDGDSTILEIGKNLAITVRNLREAMMRKAMAGEDL